MRARPKQPAQPAATGGAPSGVSIIRALAALVHSTYREEPLSEMEDDAIKELACEARREYDRLTARVAELERELAKMHEYAAEASGIDEENHYLRQRAEKAEAERDAARGQNHQLTRRLMALVHLATRISRQIKQGHKVGWFARDERRLSMALDVLGWTGGAMEGRGPRAALDAAKGLP